PGLSELRQAVCDAAAAFDPALLDRDGAVRALKHWSAMHNATAAAMALAAARVEECGAPDDSGAKDAADFVARTTGTSPGAAKRRMRTGQTMRKSDDTRSAATAGTLSDDQAAAITDAVEANPDAEGSLLALAEHGSNAELREACGRAKAAADPAPDATEARIHAKRCLRRYRDSEGAEHLHATGARSDMARLDAAL